MDSIKQLTQHVVSFRDARNWKQFHTPKDMALSLVLEAAEVAELTQWKNGAELQEALEKRREDLGDELADVLYWVLLMAHDLGVDLPEAFARKMLRNGEKYPVDQATGRSAKHDELARERAEKDRNKNDR